jgi:hypothetical protein
MARRKRPTPTAPGEREQFWRRHLLAAEAKGGALTEYAVSARSPALLPFQQIAGCSGSVRCSAEAAAALRPARRSRRLAAR